MYVGRYISEQDLVWMYLCMFTFTDNSELFDSLHTSTTNVQSQRLKEVLIMILTPFIVEAVFMYARMCRVT